MLARYLISESNITDRNVLSTDGKYGVIEKATYTCNGVSQAVAIKTCTAEPKAAKQLQAENQFFQQFAELGQANMLYVVTYLGYMQSGVSISLVLELMEKGNLASWSASANFSAGQCFEYLRHVACGVRELHTQGVIHRDIKPTNVLIGTVAKLADFGLAVRTSDKNVKIAGTPYFIAPETLFRKQNNNTETADIYAYGLTCLAASKRTCEPFNLPYNATKQDFKNLVTSMDDYSPLLGHLTSDQLKLYAIILWCCNKNWYDRPTAEELVKEFTFGNVLSQQHSIFAPATANVMLQKAIAGKSFEHAKLAFQCGADINYVSPEGASAFHMAVCSGSWDIYQLFIENGINLQDKRNQTIIVVAAGSGQALILEDLLARNLSADLHCIAGFSPVIVTIMNNHIACLKVLLEHNADPNFDKTRLALEEAVTYRRIEMIPLLMQYGAVFTPDIALDLEEIQPEERARYTQAFQRGSELREEHLRAALMMRPILNS